ncbi:amidohydrolase [Kaistella montana]|uniref:Amidohydrolase n=1 Tax=Kaistella montana TaxID=1849733 RepID=A0ABW5KBQ3_9FLAO|nr:amidohydrolase [Kaistella montana]MCQ4035697.1 amidohydrolase [Kaistella montana]
MENLKVSGLNLDITWKDKASNFHKISNLLSNESSDVFLLPEMFSTGFYMNAEETADRNEETLNWMKNFAQTTNTAVCGSAAVYENGKFYNRFYFVEPNGNYHQYDKRHLFSFSGEDKTYSPGKEKVIVNYKGWRILLQVCYDLRFPVFARNNDDYDAILYVANWPEPRIEAWKSLLKARAIENLSYVFGLNRIGTDGNDLHYPESSYCYAADGSLVSTTENNIVSAEFDAEKLLKFREKFRFLNDRDSFEVF